MALRSKAGSVLLLLANRFSAIPPLVFSDVGGSGAFTFSIWVNLIDPGTASGTFINISGKNGFYSCSLQILYNSGLWKLVYSGGGGVPDLVKSIAVPPGGSIGWTMIAISNVANLTTIYAGYQVDSDPGTTQPTINQIELFTSAHAFIFEQLAIIASHNVAICNFKYWNAMLTQPQLQSQIARWDATGGTGPKPIWSSPLRCPGDVSNVAVPNSSPVSIWVDNHVFRTSPNGDPFTLFDMFLPDPKYMAVSQPCPVWLRVPGGSSSDIMINPGTTPAVPTTYKATTFVQFEDKGAIPSNPTSFSGEYFGAVFTNDGIGISPTDSWPLVKDETGTEIATDFGNPANRFEVDTGVIIPGTPHAATIYVWKFGAQFTWGPPAGRQTSTGGISNPVLLVTYLGFPTGTQIVPINSLVGLFAIQKGALTDKYNFGLEVRIPDPTVRTAFLGE